MFDTVILLSGSRDQQYALGRLLETHRPGFTFHGATTLEDLAAIPATALPRARLIAFTTGVIVPADFLAALGHGAYNFHPGPPDYPGWAPAHFALYDGATSFGATAHEMTARVDDGPIVGVEGFVLRQPITLQELEQIAYVRCAYLFWRLSAALARPEPLPRLPLGWSGRKSTKAIYRALCDLPRDISAEELQRRVRAFSDSFRGIPLTLSLHGARFALTPPPLAPTG
jgi:methionyl-tRNA formyltransferase